MSHVTCHLLGRGEEEVRNKVKVRRTEVVKDVPHLGHAHEALTLAVERLEGLHEVGEGTGVRFGHGRFVDGQDLLELVLLLTYHHDSVLQLSTFTRLIQMWEII